MLMRTRRHQRGLSVVEMMVGVAVGLVIVAGATMLVATQLGENRRLLIETQLQQDLRAAADLVARDLRRTGAQRDPQVLAGLWADGAGAQHNLFGESLSVVSEPGTVMYRYQPSDTNDGMQGFKVEGGVLKMQRAGAGWQELTDGGVMNVTEFTITPRHAAPVQLPCPKACPDGTTDCWPTVQVRELEVRITAEARNVPEVRRTIRTTTRLRNDRVRFHDASTNQICPP